MNAKLKDKKLFLLDMDGTIYLEDDLFDGTLDFLAHVKDKGGRYLFLTNNSSKGIDKYIEKLARLGIESSPDDFLTSTEATIHYLKGKNHKKIYALFDIQPLVPVFLQTPFHLDKHRSPYRSPATP